jgi:hypothetical protein
VSSLPGGTGVKFKIVFSGMTGYLAGDYAMGGEDNNPLYSLYYVKSTGAEQFENMAMWW